MLHKDWLRYIRGACASVGKSLAEHVGVDIDDTKAESTDPEGVVCIYSVYLYISYMVDNM